MAQISVPVSWKQRIGIIAIGHAAKQIEEYLFDWLLYGTVVAFAMKGFGPIWGPLIAFSIMAPVSALVCYGYVRAYDWAKKDWFGFEAAKGIREELQGGGFWKRLVQKALRAGTIPSFVALSLYGDPFMTTIYLRKGADQYDGMSRRDWRVFFGSVFLSNGYWTLRWSVIVALLAWAWDLVPEPVRAPLLASWQWVASPFT